MKFISGKAYSQAVEEIVSLEKEMKCAVAFWGADWISHFKKLTQPIQIICNLESGATNPAIIEAFHGKANIQLKTHPKLHSKVFLTSECMIIGSANASANGMSLEDSELNGWIEAGLAVDDPVSINDAHDWFKRLWGSKESQYVEELDPSKLKTIENAWKRQRGTREKPPALPRTSLLDALKTDPDRFKDSKLIIVITREDASDDAKKAFAQIMKTSPVKGESNVDFYEDMIELPPDHFIIDLYYGPRRGFGFFGLFKTPDPPMTHRFRYDDGDYGEITLCAKLPSIDGMTISGEDEKLLKQHIHELWDSEQAIGDEDAKFIDVFVARKILFP